VIFDLKTRSELQVSGLIWPLVEFPALEGSRIFGMLLCAL